MGEAITLRRAATRALPLPTDGSRYDRSMSMERSLALAVLVAAVHGAPRPTRAMADMLALDADYRARFEGSRILPLTMRIVLPTLAVALIAVLSLALVFAAH
jgi:hypothetical protein